MCPCLSLVVLEGICISEDGFSMHEVLKCKRFIYVSTWMRVNITYPLSSITAPFNNMRNLIFKKPPTVAFSRLSINVAEVLENE